MARVRGRNCFHVRLISLSYRIRGYALRVQINIRLTVKSLATMVTSIIRLNDMDIKIAHEIIPIAIMFIYSAIKIKANVPDLYSVLNPDTSSDSPSARSNGVRFVSARAVMIHMIYKGHIMIMKMRE